MKTGVLILCMLSGTLAFAGEPSSKATTQPAPDAAVDTTAPRPLRATGTLSLRSAATGMLFLNSQCDSKQNFYFREGYPVDSDRHGSEPIEKYSQTGEKKNPLIAPDIPDCRTSLNRMSIDADDNVFVAASAAARGKAPKGYVFKWDKDGTLKTTVELDAPVRPSAVVAFKDGSLLVVGMRIPRDDGDSRNAPFTGLFDSSGKLIKQIGFEQDDMIRDMADSHSELARPWADALSSTDGNVYLLRAQSPAVIHVVSPAAEIVRTLTVDPGNPALMPSSLHESGDMLAIAFSRIYSPDAPRERIIKVVSRSSGEEIATYDPGELGVGLGCFLAPSEFTFLKLGANRGITLVKAEPVEAR